MTAINVIKRDGTTEPLQIEKIHKVTSWACGGLEVSQSELETESQLMFYNGIKTADIHDSLIKAAAALISLKAPEYTFVAARLILQKLYKTVGGSTYGYGHIADYLNNGVAEGQLSPNLIDGRFDLDAINQAVVRERDLLFTYLGLTTIEDRYLIRAAEKAGSKAEIIELPQFMWMRIAMGLALNESNPTEQAIEFYNVLSSLEFVSSTPTLFNSGTNHSQLSSCYLNTVADQISAMPGEHQYASIFGTIEENANLSKYAGGIGTDWTRIRPEGDVIKGTNGKSSGIVPYLKIFNDTAVAVNQGGKRNGAFSAYLEVWHPDFIQFCEIKKNSGDERRRAHDIFPAAWASDLFFKRVKSQGIWSFFSPNEFPELHELYGDAFEARYTELEEQGKFRFQMPAMDVWKKWLTMLFETGHPWVTFKDECNRRNPQDHAGVIHSSNLCTEITLNTSDTETAVCNLGSVNLSRVTKQTLPRVVKTAMRMLDNVIDINFYPSSRAKTSNLRHRPVGLGVMGYTEWLVKNGIDWESEAHLSAADQLFELLSYYVIEASCDLAREKGKYSSYEGSKWDRGIFPIDTARNQDCSLDWTPLREKVAQYGVRNSNMIAIAPTATIANIAGTTPCVEPIFEKYYTKTNLSGTFLIADPCLKYNKPELCKDVWEIDTKWLIKAAARRQKWIDQAQSLNIFVKNGIKGSELSEIYLMAWEEGLKTTYYLRSQSKLIADMNDPKATAETKTETDPMAEEVNLCSLDNPDCESCQ